MVKSIRGKRGLFVRFGEGTIRINRHVLQSRFGGQIELAECMRSEIGVDVSKDRILENVPKVVLDFSSVKSLDVLIEKLKELREDMVDGFKTESTQPRP